MLPTLSLSLSLSFSLSDGKIDGRMNGRTDVESRFRRGQRPSLRQVALVKWRQHSNANHSQLHSAADVLSANNQLLN